MKKKRRKKHRTIVVIREVQAIPQSQESKESTRKAKVDWILEFVLLVLLLSFIPDLYIGGMNEIFGPCGFDANTCNLTELWGRIKLVVVLLDFFVILLIVLVIMRRRCWEV